MDVDYQRSMFGLKVPLILNMIPNINSKDRNGSQCTYSSQDSLGLLGSTSSFPVPPEGPFLLIFGFIIGSVGSTAFFFCFSFRSTRRQIFACLALGIFGVALFHVALFFFLLK
jgi:hypothetical protein